MKKISLEVGKTYVDKEGNIFRIIGMFEGDKETFPGVSDRRLFITDHNLWYFKDGSVWSTDNHLHAIREEITDPLPEPGYYWLEVHGCKEIVTVSKEGNKLIVYKFRRSQGLPIVQTMGHPNDHVAINQLTKLADS